MEVIKFIAQSLLILLMISGCNNSTTFESDHITTLKLISKALENESNNKVYTDARKIVTRKMIDEANMPLLFVELPSGQNGTLWEYPGDGIGATWIGVDGATITFDKGILIASRGMGDDVMSGHTEMPSWDSIGKIKNYNRSLSYLHLDNKIFTRNLNCVIEKEKSSVMLTIFEANFLTNRYSEICTDIFGEISNIYFVDSKMILRKSKQYHSDTIGYIVTERAEK